MDGFRLTHALPSVFSTQLMPDGVAANWGLLHVVSTDTQGFFVVWLIGVDKKMASCEVRSWEDITGRPYASDADGRMHTVDSFNNARRFAEVLKHDLDYYDSIQIFKDAQHPTEFSYDTQHKIRLWPRLIFSRVEFVSFMGRDCCHIMLESEPAPAIPSVSPLADSKLEAGSRAPAVVESDAGKEGDESELPKISRRVVRLQRGPKLSHDSIIFEEPVQNTTSTLQYGKSDEWRPPWDIDSDESVLGDTPTSSI